MAKELDDGEFWLPLGFLTDDELLTDFRAKQVDDFSHGFWNSSGFNSDLSSPVGSFIGSTETESDEDDYITFLTRKIGYSTLQDSKPSSEYHEQVLKLSVSPQSSLCRYNTGSSRGSPDNISRLPSPTKVKGPVGWDLLYAAAGEVARMRMSRDMKSFYSTKPSPVSILQTKQSIMSGIYSNHKSRAAQISQQHIEAANKMRSGIWGHEKLGNQFQSENNVGERKNGLSATWPTLQQSHPPPPVPCSGMKAAYLGGNVAEKERTGTGVFLPRRYETISPEPRRKPAGGCSRALATDRLVNALNLNLDSVDDLAHTHFRDTTLKPVSRVRMAHQRDVGPQPLMNQELWLPQEWTY